MKRVVLLLIFFLPSLALAEGRVAAGTTSHCEQISILDSSSTTGAGLTGLVHNSSGLGCHYRREGDSADTDITLVTMTLGTFTSSGFIVVDGTNQPGEYEICLPDAALAVGADWVKVFCDGATNMAPMRYRIRLISGNSYGYDGALAGESGTTLTLATGAVDADDQFNTGFAIVVYDSNGLVSARSCINDSTNTGDTIVTDEDISALVAVSDNYVIMPDAGCVAATPAEVNTEVVDVMTIDTHAELAACPSGSITKLTMMQVIYQFIMFETDRTDVLQQMKKADGTTVLCDAVLSNSAGTRTKEAFITP